MQSNPSHKPDAHEHQGKFSEGLLNNDLIIEELNIGPGWTVLDAGCGNGYMSKLFSIQVGPSGKVFALDPDAYYVDILKNETHGTNIEAMVGDATKSVQLDTSSLDLIYLSTVLHGFNQKQIKGFLQEAPRLLKTDALLAIIEFAKKEAPFGPPMEFRYSPEELIDLIPLFPENTVSVAEHFYMQVFRNRRR
jgi:ubiquinone/menaquinone biosynthesis C-methylase UbiE